VNTNTDIVQQPSAWKQALVLGAAYTPLSFNEIKSGRPKPWGDGNFVYVYATVMGISYWVMLCLYLSRPFPHAFIWWLEGIGFWPLLGLLILFLVVVIPYWLISWTIKGSCALIARLTCPTELEYHKIRYQARIDAKGQECSQS
jgi:hypothetical protein